MLNEKKILCFCTCGLGTSMILNMNIQKAVSELNLKNIEVQQTNINEVEEDKADLFICAQDLLDSVSHINNIIGIKDIMNIDEYKEKISTFWKV